jgi:hypothetical protein
MDKKTVVVTLTDARYFNRAKRTIIDTRTRGKWMGEIVLITVGFDAPSNFLDYYDIIPFRVEHIDTFGLLEKYKQNPIKPTCDNREYAKLTQWDKFYVFHEYFLKWNKVLYMDAGLRVFQSIEYLLGIDCTNAIYAPDDAPLYDSTKRFGGIIDMECNPIVLNELFKEYPSTIVKERYFLNCIWMYDTSLIHLGRNGIFYELVDAMNKYPICRCNEMTIMNLLFTFNYNVWKPFPEFVESTNKLRIFGWTEHDRDYGNTTWRDFCFLKYPVTISFDCE